MLTSILNIIDKSEAELLFLQRELVAIPALGPRNGGQGEADKVNWLTTYLQQFPGANLKTIKAPDDQVACGYRPSLVVRRPGKSPRTLWIIAHTDVVPPGDLELWHSDPFVLRQEGDRIYGRGVEDNHQGLVSGLLLLRALEQGKAETDLSLGIVLVADEETNNTFGITFILREHRDIFQSDDLILVPDFGVSDGSGLEIAEKSMLWLKFTVQGKQCHASTPNDGVNSLVAASALILALDELHQIFKRTDPLFSPSISTFVPTQKEANVPNINTLPGLDVFYLDCRVLPGYALADVESEIQRICKDIEKTQGVGIDFEARLREEAAPPTDPNSPVVRRLTAALKTDRGLEARLLGIGGGTVAASFRRLGLAAVCWSTLMHTAHQPNECASIANTLADARIFAHLLFEDQNQS